MLEKPSILDEQIIACIQQAYGISITEISFLPLGADINTAVYRAVSHHGIFYFVKLRSGVFEETSVTLPKFFSDQGIHAIIPPLKTKSGTLRTDLQTFKVILYPFVEGRDGFHIEMSERLWFDFGTALKEIHTTEIPEAIKNKIHREIYSSKWRDTTRGFLEQIQRAAFADAVAAELAAFLKGKRDEILDLIAHTQRLALKLQADSPPFTVCHADIHAGNLLVDKTSKLYIVDWDTLILAPRERDLMFIGGAQGFKGHTAEEEEILFYRGYGQTQINPYALAYYRYERIIEDIAAYCQELLLTDAGGADRPQSLEYLKSNFLPGGTIEIARRSERTA